MEEKIDRDLRRKEMWDDIDIYHIAAWQDKHLDTLQYCRQVHIDEWIEGLSEKQFIDEVWNVVKGGKYKIEVINEDGSVSHLRNYLKRELKEGENKRDRGALFAHYIDSEHEKLTDYIVDIYIKD